ncbi:helix-turn-helix domain-containing protein [Leifsonia soli]|uniref:Transcriptional regulator with XRE-family HTH domain n=1 Tax=Leifsonia soli TaxID=582665 RepID=A0A852SZB5_9MICO|nr:helix-turn-helix transcriptional regulator [Leifsonia soli]NYD74586.1 transcriptional regulator with XRE-family HTH domain [Leifsonia soli]
MADNALGDYLRARRESVRPEDVGLPEDGRRRLVSGLRREEVAALAGISSEYYLRLEQGRERHPSTQVVTAIARALLLAPASEEFLHRLVRPLPDRGYEAEQTPEGADRLAAFIAALSTPAIVHDRILDVIGANPLAGALSPSFRPGVNLVEAAFLDPRVRALYVNWEEMTVRLVSYLRAQAATPPLDPRLPDLVAGLMEGSSRFAELWGRHDVGAAASGVNLLSHPVVGPIELAFERLCFAGSDHPVIVVYHAERGSASEEALARLEVVASGVAG